MLILAIIFLFATIILLVVGWYRSTTRFAVEQRIEKVMAAEAETTEEKMAKPFLQRVLLPVGDTVAKLFRNFTPAEVAVRNKKKLLMAGLYPRVTPSQFQGLCWFSAAACLALTFAFVIAYKGRDQLTDSFNIAYLCLGFLGGFVIPQFILSRRVRIRQEGIQITLPYAIDLLSISVEAGMGFDSAVGYTMRKIKGSLAEEFATTLNEIRLGKPRLEALEDLGNRAGVEDLKTFITAVVHASRLGGSITNTLRVQADSIRVRRRQRAQEMAMKAPVKMVFPLVFCIFPALFIVILAPALLNVAKTLFP